MRKRWRKKRRQKRRQSPCFEIALICRDTKKKVESSDLKSAAFCAPRVQKKKNSRPVRGQKRGKGEWRGVED